MNAVPMDSLHAALDRLFRRTAHGIRPGLEIITRLLEELEHPETAYPRVHAAGTNGKGTVCALVESVLRHAGYKTGLYTSPHLVRFHERFRIDGAPITDEDLATLIRQIEPIADRIAAETDGRPATFFECATAMAFALFQQRAIDWAVVETGMGGRWDATNVGKTAISVISRIDVDHVDYLGSTIERIADEKAGIIKPGVPVVVGLLPPEAEAVVEKVARAVGAVRVRADESVRVRRLAQDWSGQKIKVETDQRSLRPFRFPLIGRHQIENCGLAIAVLETLEAMGRINLTDEALRDGLAEVQWPARCQILEREPLVLLDVAHNPSGAAALAATLKEAGGNRPIGLVAGFLADKDATRCLESFSTVVRRCWAVPVPHERGMDAETLLDCANRAGLAAEAMSLDAALSEAKAWAREQDGIVCLAGSLYLAGEVLRGYEDRA